MLPELVSGKRDRGQQGPSIWSTACTRGEEPYSITILVAEFLGHRLRDFNIAIVETPTDKLRGRLECLDSKAKVY